MRKQSHLLAARKAKQTKRKFVLVAVGVGCVGAVVAACSPAPEGADDDASTFQGRSTLVEGGGVTSSLGLEQTVAPPDVPAAAAATTKAPSANNAFKRGARFDASCVVAWPSAPIRASDEIEMTMTCAGVPQQYAFVEVVYGDPKLPITPDTGAVEVQGTVADVATSEMGFQELVVQADHVTIH